MISVGETDIKKRKPKLSLSEALAARGYQRGFIDDHSSIEVESQPSNGNSLTEALTARGYQRGFIETPPASTPVPPSPSLIQRALRFTPTTPEAQYGAPTADELQRGIDAARTINVTPPTPGPRVPVRAPVEGPPAPRSIARTERPLFPASRNEPLRGLDFSLPGQTFEPNTDYVPSRDVPIPEGAKAEFPVQGSVIPSVNKPKPPIWLQNVQQTLPPIDDASEFGQRALVDKAREFAESGFTPDDKFIKSLPIQYRQYFLEQYRSAVSDYGPLKEQNIVAKIGSGVGRASVGILDAGLRTASKIAGFPGPDADLTDAERAFKNQIIQTQRGADDLSLGENVIGRNVVKAAEIAPPMLVGVAASAATGGLSGPAALTNAARVLAQGAFWATQIFPQEYERLRDAGVDDTTARNAAFLSAAVQGAVENLNINPFSAFKGGAGGLRQRLVETLQGYGKELVLEEGGQAIVSEAIAGAVTDGVDPQAIVSAATQAIDEAAGPLAVLMAGGAGANINRGIQESLDARPPLTPDPTFTADEQADLNQQALQATIPADRRGGTPGANEQVFESERAAQQRVADQQRQTDIDTARQEAGRALTAEGRQTPTITGSMQLNRSQQAIVRRIQQQPPEENRRTARMSTRDADALIPFYQNAGYDVRWESSPRGITQLTLSAEPVRDGPSPIANEQRQEERAPQTKRSILERIEAAQQTIDSGVLRPREARVEQRKLDRLRAEYERLEAARVRQQQAGQRQGRLRRQQPRGQDATTTREQLAAEAQLVEPTTTMVDALPPESPQIDEPEYVPTAGGPTAPDTDTSTRETVGAKPKTDRTVPRTSISDPGPTGARLPTDTVNQEGPNAETLPQQTEQRARQPESSGGDQPAQRGRRDAAGPGQSAQSTGEVEAQTRDQGAGAETEVTPEQETINASQQPISVQRQGQAEAETQAAEAVRQGRQAEVTPKPKKPTDSLKNAGRSKSKAAISARRQIAREYDNLVNAGLIVDNYQAADGVTDESGNLQENLALDRIEFGPKFKGEAEAIRDIVASKHGKPFANTAVKILKEGESSRTGKGFKARGEDIYQELSDRGVDAEQFIADSIIQQRYGDTDRGKFEAVREALQDRETLKRADPQTVYALRVLEALDSTDQTERQAARGVNPTQGDVLFQDQLKVGDEFEIAGDKYRVIESNEDGTTIKDGVEIDLDPGEPIAVDSGTAILQQVQPDIEEEGDTSFNVEEFEDNSGTGIFGQNVTEDLKVGQQQNLIDGEGNDIGFKDDPPPKGKPDVEGQNFLYQSESSNEGGKQPNDIETVPFDVDNLRKVFRMRKAEAEAVVSLTQAMDIDTSKVSLSKGRGVGRALRGGLTPGNKNKAAVEFTREGRAIIYATSAADVSSAVHEMAHIARRTILNRDVPTQHRAGISDADIRVAEDWAGAPDGNWTRSAEERFARGFERYLRDGKAPTKPLKGVFAKMRNWLSGIYKRLKGSPINLNVSPEMRGVFDKLVSRAEPEIVVETSAQQAARKKAEAVRRVREEARRKRKAEDDIRKQVVEAARENLDVKDRGKIITQVRDANTAKGLEKAAQRIEEVAAESDKKQAILDLGNAIKDAKSAKLRPEYAQVVDDITNELSLKRITTKTRRALQATADYLANNEDAIVPKEVIKELQRLNQTTVAEMTADDIREVTKAIKMATHLSKLKNNLIGADRKRSRDAVAKQIIDDIDKRVPKVLPDRKPSWVRRVHAKLGGPTPLEQGPQRNVFNQLLKEGSTRPEVLMEHLSPELQQQVWEDIGVKAHHIENRSQWEFRDALRKAVDAVAPSKMFTEAFERWRLEPLQVHTRNGKVQMTRDEAIWLYTTLRDPTNKEIILREGITLNRKNQRIRIDEGAVDEHIGDAEQAISDHLFFQFNGELKRKLNEDWVKVYGVEIADVENYVPRRVDMYRANTQVDPIEKLADNLGTTLTSWGSLKSRIGSGAPLQIRNAHDVYMEHVDHVSRISAYLVPVTNAHSIIGRADVKQKIIERAGKPGYDRILDSIQKQVVRQREGPAGMTIRQSSRLIGAGILGLRISPLLKNPSGLFIAATYQGPQYLARAIKSGVSPAEWKRVTELARRYSPYWRTRYDDFVRQSTSGVASIQRGFGGRSVGEKALLPLEQSDKFGGIIRWKMAELYVKKTRGIDESAPEYYDEVAREWERSMYRSENTAHGMELSGALSYARTNAAFAPFVMFSSSTSKIYSAAMRSVLAGQRGDKKQAALSAAGFIGATAWAALIGQMLSELRNPPDDDEQFVEKVAKRAARDAVRSIPVLGSLALEPLLVKVLQERPGMYTGNLWIDQTRAAIGGVGDIYDATRNWLDETPQTRNGMSNLDRFLRGLDRTAEAATPLFGVPYGGAKDVWRLSSGLYGEKLTDKELIQKQGRKLRSKREAAKAWHQKETRRLLRSRGLAGRRTGAQYQQAMDDAFKAIPSDMRLTVEERGFLNWYNRVEAGLSRSFKAAQAAGEERESEFRKREKAFYRAELEKRKDLPWWPKD